MKESKSAAKSPHPPGKHSGPLKEEIDLDALAFSAILGIVATKPRRKRKPLFAPKKT